MTGKIKVLFAIFILLNLLNCKGQTLNERSILSDDFDISQPIYYGMPDFVDSKDTSAVWSQGTQRLLLTGTVFQIDGKTPAPDILIYYYHTDKNGQYIHKEDVEESVPPNKLGQTHGHIRGWVKTDSNGQYSIYTIKPGSYPSRTEAAHIHIYIKEPDRQNHYYIDNVVFDDDQLLTKQKRSTLKNLGGSGIVSIIKEGEFQICQRNIILGYNIPDYLK